MQYGVLFRQAFRLGNIYVLVEKAEGIGIATSKSLYC